MPITPTTSGPVTPLTHLLAHPTSGFHRLAAYLTSDARSEWPILVTLLGVGVVTVIAVQIWTLRVARNGKCVVVDPPAETDPAAGAGFWRMVAVVMAGRRALLPGRPAVAFEMWATDGSTQLRWWAPGGVSATAVARAVETAWPGARATLVHPPPPFARTLTGRRLVLSGRSWLPLGGTGERREVADPIGGVLSTLAATGTGNGNGGGEGVVVQVVARPARRRTLARARRAVAAARRGRPANGRWSTGLVTNGPGPSTADPLALADARDGTAKLTAGPHFEVAIRFAVAGGSKRHRRARCRQLAAAYGLYAGRSHLVARVLWFPDWALTSRRVGRGFLVSLPELASLAHLPATPARYGLTAAPARTVAPPRVTTDG